MSSFRLPGPVGWCFQPQEVEDGTLCREPSPLPGQVNDHPVANGLQTDLCAGDLDSDPNDLLSSPLVCPSFAAAARAALSYAICVLKLHPIVHEAYRAPERSNVLYQKYKNGGPRAAPAWASCHNYGLAMDVWLYDERKRKVDGRKDWYSYYKKFDSAAKQFNLIWGEPINDADHWEYHPNWPQLAGKKLLMDTRSAAMQEADAASSKSGSPADWLPVFWRMAGAGG